MHVSRFSHQVKTQLIKQGLKIGSAKDDSTPEMPEIWLCDLCKMLVDRDYEMSLINIQVSQINSETHTAAAKEYKPQIQAKPEDKTGLGQLLEVAKDKI